MVRRRLLRDGPRLVAGTAGADDQDEGCDQGGAEPAGPSAEDHDVEIDAGNGKTFRRRDVSAQRRRAQIERMEERRWILRNRFAAAGVELSTMEVGRCGPPCSPRARPR
jgi:hypothetical protein